MFGNADHIFSSGYYFDKSVHGGKPFWDIDAAHQVIATRVSRSACRRTCAGSRQVRGEIPPVTVGKNGSTG